MSILLRGWLWRARRAKQRTKASEFWEARRALIRRLALNQSFLDLGGMLGVDGEVAFLAEEAGAKRVVLYDAMDPTEEFEAARERRGSEVTYVQGDLHDPQSVEELGTFDVVWCAGVVYHSPNPYLLLEHLWRLTDGQLMLGTHVIPEVPGFKQACLFYPGLPERARQAFAWAHGAEARDLLGPAAPFRRTARMGYSNFWWGIAPSALLSMLDAARFKVIEQHRRSPFFVDLVATPIERPSLIPQTSFARTRGAQRRVGVAASVDGQTSSALERTSRASNP